MRVAFTSDLHVDHHPEVVGLIAERARSLAPDVLVVAGDISPVAERLEGSLRALRAAAPRLLYVPGNHDLWGPDARARYLEELPALCAAARADFLPAGPVVVEGVTIVGQTGWYDYSLRDPDLPAPLSAYESGRFGRLAWTDKRFFHWPGLDDAGVARWMAGRLAADLAVARGARAVVVVTHMLPFAELVPRRPAPWSFVAGFLGAAVLGDAIRAAAAEGLPVAHVIAGHTHFRRAVTVGAGGRAVPAETSPIGYPREVRFGGRDLVAHVAERLRVVEVR